MVESGLIARVSPAQESRWQKDNSTQKRQEPINGDADDPKRQQQDPDDRVKKERKQRDRPAEHEQNAPKQKLQHAFAIRTARQ